MKSLLLFVLDLEAFEANNKGLSAGVLSLSGVNHNFLPI
jgi:hypothetical protein